MRDLQHDEPKKSYQQQEKQREKKTLNEAGAMR
jgi:hypothetical protein